MLHCYNEILASFLFGGKFSEDEDMMDHSWKVA